MCLSHCCSECHCHSHRRNPILTKGVSGKYCLISFDFLAWFIHQSFGVTLVSLKCNHEVSPWKLQSTFKSVFSCHTETSLRTMQITNIYQNWSVHNYPLSYRENILILLSLTATTYWKITKAMLDYKTQYFFLALSIHCLPLKLLIFLENSMWPLELGPCQGLPPLS